MSSEEEESPREEEEEEEEEISKELERGNGMEKIEKRFEELKEEYFSSKMEEIEKERIGIELETHEGYSNKCLEYNQEYLDKRVINERWKEYQLSNINNVATSSLKHANDQISSDIQSIKSNLIKSIKEKKSKLLNLKSLAQKEIQIQQTSLQSNPPKSSPLKRTKTEEKEDESILTRRKVDPLILKYTLKESEIYEDWILIQRSNPPDSPWNDDCQPLDDIKVEKGTFFFHNQLFTVGKNVCIESIYEVDTKWVGSLSLVSPLEIQLVSNDGTRCRFSLSQFRNRKYSISFSLEEKERDRQL
eukprot:TRINITY_DN2301_c0_g1_i1.p1 TRINITY_DN2301_c0_g1~~TRINITY_DN2301_c0_g1_i1.p1  ORF type:complete len:303 (-),score=105.31 TRINITY_DN2301_c0_g1_i1:41-949(-)